MVSLKKPVVLTALLGTMALQGCATFGQIVYEAETARLENLRTWEANLTVQGCSELKGVHKEMLQTKDALVDFDQRQDILRDALAEKTCDLPDELV